MFTAARRFCFLWSIRYMSQKVFHKVTIKKSYVNCTNEWLPCKQYCVILFLPNFVFVLMWAVVGGQKCRNPKLTKGENSPGVGQRVQHPGKRGARSKRQEAELEGAVRKVTAEENGEPQTEFQPDTRLAQPHTTQPQKSAYLCNWTYFGLIRRNDLELTSWSSALWSAECLLNDPNVQI